MVTLRVRCLGDGDSIKPVPIPHNPDTSKNSQAPISRLPYDILASIFVDSAHDYYRHQKHSCLTKSVPSWVNVSYVCRRWRDVALDCPMLWTYFFDASEQWTEALLARSQQTPLKVYVAFPRKKDNLEKTVLAHLDRIEELQLMFLSYDYRLLCKLLSKPAPSLRLLFLWMPPMQRESFQAVPFQGNAPALRELKLPWFPWPSFAMTDLTTLRLSGVREVELRQSIPDFFALLGHMPGLVYLDVHDSLASATGFLSSGAFHATPRIDLPRLSELSVTAPFSAVIALLSCVNLPSKAQLRLQCDPEMTSTPDDSVQLWSLLSQRFSRPNEPEFARPAIHSLTVKASIGMLMLTFGTSVASERHSPSGSDRSIPLEVTIIPMSYDHIDDLCRYMPLTGIQSVSFHSPPFSLSYWTKTLALFPNLRHIKFAGGAMPDVASLFSLFEHAFTENHGGQVEHSRRPMPILSSLEKLEIHDMRLTASPLSYRMRGVADLQSFYEAISTRKCFPCGLTMTRCHLQTTSSCTNSLDLVGWWEDDQFRVTAKIDGRDLLLPLLDYIQVPQG